ncbi:sigma-70 family RNA polymerase sigma factor [Stieleria sp. JC731]|uniref:sigma-70 family RNA polymerase sigma factor n=1 Tax=Pirellulaceae TaxID=2691357 RepID=UPI001E56FB17|nr:sigma-70 family RNA polymerase sigma factor [Stieleria sp. JC731]MCC9603484.1 sigma-70 family RNA polymerase sigma factor [Stieleria sp. JC731]
MLSDFIKSVQLSDDEQLRLIKNVQEDNCEESLMMLIRQYLDAIESICNSGSTKCKQTAEERESLAVEAVINSVRKFDENRGTKPSTYIFQSMLNSVFDRDEAGPIRISKRRNQDGKFAKRIPTQAIHPEDKVFSESLGPEEEAVEAEEKEINEQVLDRILNILSEDDRKLYADYKRHGFVQVNLANEYGISRGTAHSRIKRLTERMTNVGHRARIEVMAERREALSAC